MRLPRDAFIGHFSPVFQAHGLKFWRRRAKEPPETMPRCLLEWTRTANGRTDVFPEDFRSIVWPVIERLHREGKGERPTPAELTGAVDDALSAAEVEVTIGPARHGHD
ncbi:hypothetical protein [Reyranella sp.]|uniref:hypothetical protein n=1 Tax=Reyranella sp. TaxID=1929291 RepID=UPI003D0C2205